MSRTVNVVRMQLINKDTYLWIPVLVLAGSFVITLAIYGIIISAAGSELSGEPMYGGGAQAPLWYFAVVGAQAMTLTFPFSQAMSVTRREFYLGTLLTASLASGILAVVFVLGGLIENATNGWGFGGYFFYLPWIWESGPLVAGLLFFALAMLFFAIGFVFATVFKRAGLLAMSALVIIASLALLFVLWLITANKQWPQVIGWFVEVGPLGVALGLLGVVAVIGIGSYGVLRRAIP